jgi:hypothetical protein
MANWEKLNKELDDALDSMTPEDWKLFVSKRANKRTPAERKIASIRKEIAILVNEQGIGIGKARSLMNAKYGKGWRERGLVSNSDNQWSESELQPYLNTKKRK